MDTRPWTHKCIGVILANNAILTAAKCVENREEDLKIRTGNENLDNEDNAVIYELRSDFRLLTNEAGFGGPVNVESTPEDIALVFTKHNMMFNQHTQAICLNVPRNEEEGPIPLPYQIEEFENKGAKYTTWNARKSLESNYIKIVPMEPCYGERDLNETEIRETPMFEVLCAEAGLNSSFFPLACSGAPLIMENQDRSRQTLLGIRSFSEDCGSYYSTFMFLNLPPDAFNTKLECFNYSHCSDDKVSFLKKFKNVN